MDPCFTGQNIGNCHYMNAKYLRKLISAASLRKNAYAAHIGFSQLGSTHALSHGFCSVSIGVHAIFGWASPTQIGQFVIRFVAIAVAGISAFRTLSNKGFKDYVVDKAVCVSKSYAHVAMASDRRREDASFVSPMDCSPSPFGGGHTVNRSNAPEVAYFVAANLINHWKPFFSIHAAVYHMAFTK